MKIQGIFAASSPKTYHIDRNRLYNIFLLYKIAIYANIAVSSCWVLYKSTIRLYDTVFGEIRELTAFFIYLIFIPKCQRQMKSGYLQSIVAFTLRLTVRQLFPSRNSTSRKTLRTALTHSFSPAVYSTSSQSTVTNTTATHLMSAVEY